MNIYGCSGLVAIHAMGSHLLDASLPSSSLALQTFLYNAHTPLLLPTVGNSSQASCLSRNSAMDDSIGDS